jgi:hypothetical protein
MEYTTVNFIVIYGTKSILTVGGRGPIIGVSLNIFCIAKRLLYYRGIFFGVLWIIRVFIITLMNYILEKRDGKFSIL